MKRFSCWPWSRPLGTHDHTTDWQSSARHCSSFSHHQIWPQSFLPTCSVSQRRQWKGDRQKLILIQRAVQQRNCRRFSSQSSRTLFHTLQQDPLPVNPVRISSLPNNLSLSFARAPSGNLTQGTVPQHHQQHCCCDSFGVVPICTSNIIHFSCWHIPLCWIHIFFLIFLHNNDLEKKRSVPNVYKWVTSFIYDDHVSMYHVSLSLGAKW